MSLLGTTCSASILWIEGSPLREQLEKKLELVRILCYVHPQINLELRYLVQDLVQELSDIGAAIIDSATGGSAMLQPRYWTFFFFGRAIFHQIGDLQPPGEFKPVMLASWCLTDNYIASVPAKLFLPPLTSRTEAVPPQVWWAPSKEFNLCLYSVKRWSPANR